MDCRSCGVVNAPGRRYCRECGTRLGQPCQVCHFFNAVEDKHCGGCGHRLKASSGPLCAVAPPSAVGAQALTDDMDFGDFADPVPPVTPAESGIAGQGVSQLEIDGLFENILDEESEQAEEGGA